MHAQKVWDVFEIKSCGEYHDLYVQSDTLITDYDMLLMIEKGIRGGICQATHSYVKANNKYMKNYDKNNEPSYIEYLDANNLYGWAMSQKLPVDGFKWVKQRRLSKFNEDFIKNMMKIVIQDVFLK